MKQLTCAQMGGPADCTATASGENIMEIGQNIMPHVEEAHPEMAAQIKASTPEEMADWAAKTQAVLDAQPEM